jgi:signal transduction histidine kinase
MSAIAEKAETREPHLPAARVDMIRAIHDGVVQDLFGIALTLDALSEQPGADIRDCADSVRRVLTELRAILDEATPETLSAREAPTHAPTLVERLREAAGEVDLDVDLDAIRSAPATVAGAIANFAAEGVRNARKHADCTYVTVGATQELGVLRVSVENDGLRRTRTDPGVGLRLLELDAQRLGGFLTAGPLEETWQLILTLPIADPT